MKLLTECPYCHRKVAIIGANILKTKGEHSCRGCKCISNVVIHRALYAIAGLAVASSLIIMLLYSTSGDVSDPRGILYVFIPFLIFYILVPFFVKLEPCGDRSAVNKLHRRIDPVPIKQEKPVKIAEQPIELNVGDDFTRSFLLAKNTKVTEDDGEDKYNRIISESNEDIDITSGIDIDISGTMNISEENEGAGTAEDTVPEAPPDIEAEQGNEVSFSFGRIHQEEV